MIKKLMEEKAAAEKKHDYCEKQMKQTQSKQDSKERQAQEISIAIDGASAKSKKLKEQVAELERELADLAKTQAEMDRLRQQEKAGYEKDKPELENGIRGVKLALKVLQEYYAKDDKGHDDANEGAASGIIGLLEVVESDFSKGLAELEAEESAAKKVYEIATEENAMTKTK